MFAKSFAFRFVLFVQQLKQFDNPKTRKKRETNFGLQTNNQTNADTWPNFLLFVNKTKLYLYFACDAIYIKPREPEAWNWRPFIICKKTRNVLDSISVLYTTIKQKQGRICVPTKVWLPNKQTSRQMRWVIHIIHFCFHK